MKVWRAVRKLLLAIAVLLGVWVLLEIIMRLYVDLPLKTDFYGSISREEVLARQAAAGVKVAAGPGWIHLGWIADPERESYRVERLAAGQWTEIGHSQFGSFLWRGDGGAFRVFAVPKGSGQPRLIGEVSAQPASGSPPLYRPVIAGPWQFLFQPRASGYYINDHTIFHDAEGNWRLVGITSKTDGDYNQERYFAVGVSKEFPPSAGMTEEAPIADFGELAWAPHVIKAGGSYHMFWSPHKLHQMDSADGITWANHRITLSAPYHRFFRDPMVLQVAEDQWLLYTTARGAYFSQVDVYQSFDLEGWQYIGTALRSGWGSERNSHFASMESPFVMHYQGRYYLSFTYNNDSFFWPGILLQFHIWLNPASYNETLVFHSDNPYDFGVYRGRHRSPTFVASLSAHAPEYVLHPDTGEWYITTAGWPWVATLTAGEVAVAPLKWELVSGR